MKELDNLIDQIAAGGLDSEEAISQAKKYYRTRLGEEEEVTEENIVEADGEEDYEEVEVEVEVEVPATEGGISNSDIEKQVAHFLMGYISKLLSLPESEVDVQSNFLDIGLSSSQLIQMTEQLENEWKLTLYPTLLFEYQNVNDLSHYLSGEYGEQIGKTLSIEPSQSQVVKQKKKIKKKVKKQKLSKKASVTTGTKELYHDVAIIGIGGRFPKSPDLESFWEQVRDQKDLIREVPKDRWDYKEVAEKTGEEVRWGGFMDDIDQFDPAFFGLSPREAELMDPQQRLLLETIWHTVEDAGYKMSHFAGSNTGLFVGVATTDYAELMVESETPVEAFTSIGTTHSIVSNRISYLFDLHGPSMSIDTACSSSLVALYEAVQSIRTGKCSAALVGGVNAMITPKLFVSFSKAGMLSKDGRCKTFDKSANGYVRGEGVGAVLLKPLEQAKKDGDHIYAVIKGCAINHGGHSNSLTAPNPVAQSRLIQDAVKDAQIAIQSISYVEAHGTGTSLGDPIEIEGLKKAYHAMGASQSEVKEPKCGIGTVKTCIGHLEAAAGIAGILKTVLSMKHQTLPGILHYHSLNPFIDMSGTPFYIVDKTREWKRLLSVDGQEIPRRAGISSFGFGGANAHVILEEYVAEEQENEVEEGMQILPFSAKSKEQLDEQIEKFYEYLKTGEEIPENQEEKAVAEDTMALCTDMVSKLIGVSAEEIDPEEMFRELGLETKEYEDLAEMVNEQFEQEFTADVMAGAKNIEGVVKLLTNEEPSAPVAKTVTLPRLSEIAATLQQGREEMNERLVVIGRNVDEVKRKLKSYLDGGVQEVFYNNTKANKIADTLMSGNTGNQIFDLLLRGQEYEKIAQIWLYGGDINWEMINSRAGKRRVTLPGYPFKKKRYWIPQSAKQVTVCKSSIQHELLDENKSTLQEVVYEKTLTGDEFYLAHHIVNGKKVLPGAAYVEMARAAAMLCGDGTVSKISNVSWIYPVTVSDKSRTIEIGLKKGGSDVIFAVRSKEGVHAKGSIGYGEPQKEQKIDISSILERCQKKVTKDGCYAEFRGMGLNYGEAFQTIEALYEGRQEACAHLVLSSGYESASMIIHPSLLDGAFQTVMGCIPDRKQGCTYLPYQMKELTLYGKFTAESYVHATVTSKDANGYMANIIISDKNGQITAKMEGFYVRAIGDNPTRGQNNRESSKQMFYCVPHSKESKIADEATPNCVIAVVDSEEARFQSFQKSPLLAGCQMMYVGLGREYEKIDGQTYRIGKNSQEDAEKLVSQWKEQGNVPDEIWYTFPYQKAEGVMEKLENVIGTFRCLVQASIKKNLGKKAAFRYIGQGDQEASGLDAGVAAFARSVKEEDGNLFVESISLENMAYSDDQLAKILAKESTQNKQETVYYRQGSRLVRQLNEVKLIGNAADSSIKEKGIYLLSGGLGKIGLTVTEWLMSKQDVTVILLGRSALTKEKEVQLERMKKGASQIIYMQADITKKEELEKAVEQIHQRFGTIDGVFHCAGVQCDGLLRDQSDAEFKKVVLPKILGTVNLHEATREDSLGFFVMFSSIASALGNAGQTAYSLANGYLDWFAGYRQGSGKTISINWPLWESGGMTVTEQMKEFLRTGKGLDVITNEEAMECLEQILSSQESQVVLLAGEKQKIKKRYCIDAKASGKVVKKKIVKKSEEQIKEELAESLVAISSELLHIEKEDISLQEDISEYGFDSILLTSFSNTLNEKYQMDTTPAIFFAHPTLQSLKDALYKEYGNKLSEESEEIEEIMEDPDYEMEELDTEHAEYSFTFFDNPESRLESESIPSNSQNACYEREDIAIVGIGGKMPQAKNLQEFWSNLEDGKDCITEVPKDRWDWKQYYGNPKLEDNKTNVKWGGFMPDVDKFDPLFFGISPSEAELMDPQHRNLMQTVWKTIEDAGYRPSDLSGTSTGLFVGVSTSDYAQRLIRNQVPVKAQTATGKSNAVLANRISYILNLKGPSESVDTACSSALVAVNQAVRAIQNGDCNMAIAGGVNVLADPELYISFSKSGMLCEDGRCKTFDERANGYVRGEGVGAIFLKSLKQAKADGDYIYGVIKGCAVNHGGHANSLTAPNPNAQAELLVHAYEQANIPINTVTYIETHGTGTSLGDPIEVNGLKQAFEELQKKSQLENPKEPYCGLSAVKTNIGHLEAASGIAGLIKVLLAMKYGKIPGVLHFEKLNPYIELKGSPFYIVEQIKDWNRLKDKDGNEIPRRAGVSSFGFGGTNAHVVIEEYRN